MAVGSSYPSTLVTLDGIERESGTIRFDDSTNQPAPGGSSNEATAKDFKATGLTGAVSASRYVGATATVAPTTGTFAVGDFVIAQNGDIFVCTAAGSPGTWVVGSSVSLAPKASPTFTGTVTVPAAAAATSAPRLSDLSSALTIASGTLPNTGAWVSATAKVNPVTRQVTCYVESAFDGTNNAASVVIAVSSDNTTFTTVGTPSVAAAINNLGAITVVTPVSWPAGWYIKLTIAAHAAVAASIYY